MMRKHITEDINEDSVSAAATPKKDAKTRSKISREPPLDRIES